MSVPIIDPDQFNMLVETGEDAAVELLEDLLALFREEAEPRFNSLKSAADQGNTEQIGKVAHALAGSSGNLGGLRLCHMSRALENEVESIPSNEIPLRVAEIESLYSETITAFQARITELQQS